MYGRLILISIRPLMAADRVSWTKLINIAECDGLHIGRRCKAIDMIDSAEELLMQYPAPTHLQIENGPEFIAPVLQDLYLGNGSCTDSIPSGSP
jgi:hypothetical protein